MIPKSLHQPKALYTLFFTQMWERFSYYGMRALFVLYLTKALLFSDDQSYALYGAYTTLVYAGPILGGMLADRFLGYRRAVLFGGILTALGHFTLAIPSASSLYLGLAFLIAGNGLLKPNITSLLGNFYTQHDPRRDAGFTFFYVGVNLGGFLAPLFCGYIGEKFGWHYGFALAGIGMLAGLLTFVKNKHLLEHHGEPLHPERLKARTPIGLNLETIIYIGTLLCIPFIAYLTKHTLELWVLGLITLILSFLIGKIFIQSSAQTRRHLALLLVFMFLDMCFWAFNEQAGTSLNLFTDRDISHTLWGLTATTSQFQSVNSAFILLLGPFLANLWTTLGRLYKDFSAGIKFGLGLLQLAAGFGVVTMGAHLAATTGHTVSMLWLIAGYFLMTTGELCVEPVGLSVVTQLSPAPIVGLLMGCWYLVGSSYANFIAAKIAELTSVAASDSTNVALSSLMYYKVFYQIAIAACVIGVLTLLANRWIKKLAR